MKRLNMLILIATCFCLCIISSVNADDNDPWWTQGYSADTEVVTTYTYDAGGARIPTIDTTNATITFFDTPLWTADKLDEDEQATLAVIRTIKEKQPEIERPALIDQVLGEVPDTTIDTIENMIGFDEYENATGYFEYLNTPPSERAIAIHDAWFALYQNEYYTPPRTLAEMEEINAAVYTNLAKQFKSSPFDIKNTLHKIEKYQEKFNIPKNVPLSQSLQQISKA